MASIQANFINFALAYSLCPGWDIMIQQAAALYLCLLLQNTLVTMCSCSPLTCYSSYCVIYFSFSFQVVKLRDFFGVLIWGSIFTCPSHLILLCLISIAMLLLLHIWCWFLLTDFIRSEDTFSFF